MVEPSGITAAVFWSYAHEDNRLDGGGILGLATHLREELSLSAGTDIAFFVDRDELKWGEEWRRRIDTALAQTTFFIPIITPRFFASEECRRELFAFVGQARSLGLLELVLPVLYVDVPRFGSENSDEAVALVSRMQYVDWRKLRLLGERSTEYRVALNSLAQRLLEVAVRLIDEDVQRSIERAAQPEEEPGLLDLLMQIEEQLPGWTESLEAADTASKQWLVVCETYVNRLQKLRTPDGQFGGGPQYAVLQRWVAEGLPLTQKLHDSAKNYLGGSLKLDPMVLSAIREGQRFPELAQPLLNGLREKISNINTTPESPEEQARETLLERYSRLSKAFRQMVSVYQEGRRAAIEGDEIVRRWQSAFE